MELLQAAPANTVIEITGYKPDSGIPRDIRASLLGVESYPSILREMDDYYSAVVAGDMNNPMVAQLHAALGEASRNAAAAAQIRQAESRTKQAAYMATATAQTTGEHPHLQLSSKGWVLRHLTLLALEEPKPAEGVTRTVDAHGPLARKYVFSVALRPGKFDAFKVYLP